MLSKEFTYLTSCLSNGKGSVYFEDIIADLDTPVSAFLKLAEGEDYSCLLESVEGGERRGRYSVLGIKPDIVWSFNGDKCETITLAPDGNKSTEVQTGSPLALLRALVAESRLEMPPELAPMAAGLVGYMGYDMVHLMEPVGVPKEDPLELPTSVFFRPTLMAVFDSVRQSITLVSPVRPESSVKKSGVKEAGVKSADLINQARRLVRNAREKLLGSIPHADIYPLSAEKRDVGAHSDTQLDACSGPNFKSQIRHHSSAQDYAEKVRKAQDYILAGDIFQVVLSQRFSRPFELPPFALYRALRRTNPSPFMYYLNLDGFQVVGSSPEILVRLENGDVTIRPIAGTRPRGATAEEDQALEEDLLKDPKERAEHLMLLDLGRSDVGRIAEAGTVRVTDSFNVERYSHVMHIVSNVTGKVRPETDALDAIQAGFPAGTVSGAPKVRAMQIINELEDQARGPYAGSVGYFSAGGTMDSCIVLRTAIIKEGTMYVQAGAGIVADSDIGAEQQECVNKSMALFAAAEEADRLAKR